MAGKKRTTAYKGATLDLTYITGRIIAAGFPANGITSMYRNSRTTLVDYLKSKHNEMVKIYNLCAEDGFSYTSEHVGGLNIGKFPFSDHNVSSIQRILEFSVDASLFL